MALSDKLRGMRFMQRKDEQAERERLESERQKRLETMQWNVKSSSKRGRLPRVVMDSQTQLAGPQLSSARRSFGKFNKSVEKSYSEALRQAGLAEKRLSNDERNSASVSEEQMAAALGKKSSKKVGMKSKLRESGERESEEERERPKKKVKVAADWRSKVGKKKDKK